MAVPCRRVPFAAIGLQVLGLVVDQACRPGARLSETTREASSPAISSWRHRDVPSVLRVRGFGGGHPADPALERDGTPDRGVDVAAIPDDRAWRSAAPIRHP